MQKEKIRKSISIDPDLFKSAEKAATNDNRTFSNLVSVLLEKFLHKK